LVTVELAVNWAR